MALTLDSSSTMKVLADISENLHGNFQKGVGWAKMSVDNDNGKGNMTAIHVFSGMGAITYDIVFHREFSFTLVKEAMNPMYFIFCLDGHFKHKYGEEKEYSFIDNKQNAIIKGVANAKNEVVVPKDVHMKISIIYIDETRIANMAGNGQRPLALYLNELFASIDESKPFRYLGKIRPMTAEYVGLLFKSKKKGVVGRLLTESYILRILSSQIAAHDQAKEKSMFSEPLRKKDVKTIVKMGEYIHENIESRISIDALQKKSGLDAKKLQVGFRGLFGMSVNTYVSKVRLEKARELIETTDMTISEVVYLCGLNSRSYFSKIFSERFGILPSEYRKSHVSSM